MRRLIAAFLSAAALAFPAHAVTFATDASDLWFNANESGWGANVIQQADTLFVTLFVYDSSGKPTWYVGSSVDYAGADVTGLIYTGKLYQTNGPWFGGAFNAAPVNLREVGTVTFTLNTLTTATLAYDADGVHVTKQLSRQTWKSNNLAGSYFGATVGTWSGCPAGNGYVEESATTTVTQDTTIRIVLIQPSGSCTLSGTFTAGGRLGSATGTVSCTANLSNGLPATNGTFSAAEIEGSVVAMSGRAAIQLGSCQWHGRFGGLRRGS
jgi:hypothetical protein